MVLKEIIEWLVNNIPILVVTSVLSALISGLIGHGLRRRLVIRAERRDHLKQIQSEVMHSMLMKLKSCKSQIHANVGGSQLALPLEPTRPTQSSLYDTLPEHFRPLSTSYNKVEGDVKEFGEKCVLFQSDLRTALTDRTGLPVYDPNNISRPHLVTRDGLLFLYQSFFNEDIRQETRVRSELVLQLDDQDDRSILTEFQIRGSIVATGSSQEMKKLARAYLNLIDDANSRERAARLQQSKEEVLRSIEDVKREIQDALAQSVLKGKCKYCHRIDSNRLIGIVNM